MGNICKPAENNDTMNKLKRFTKKDSIYTGKGDNSEPRETHFPEKKLKTNIPVDNDTVCSGERMSNFTEYYH